MRSPNCARGRLLAPPKTRYLLEPAFVAIEILSEDDRMSNTLEKLREYEAAGIPNIWMFDPRLEQIFEFRDGSLLEVRGDVIGTKGSPDLELTRAEIFPPAAPPLDAAL